MKTKLLFITFLLMATCFQLTAQTIVFDGDTDSDWNTAANWVGDVLPGPGNGVDLDGNTVVLSADATVQRILVDGSGEFTVNSGVTLTITGFAGGDDGLEIQNSGTVINNGTIAISNIDISNTDADGLYNKGNFTNNGAITIDGTGQHGIYLQQGTFTNSATGTITITNTGQGDGGANYVYMDDNGGTPAIFHNHGELDITMTGNDDGIYIKDGSALTNHSTGEIEIISTGGGDMPLHIVGLNGSATATTLTNAGDEAIQIEDATVSTGVFNNSGTVNITTPADHGMECFGTFNNMNGGTFNATGCPDDGVRLQDNGVFNNDGAIAIDGSGSEDIETETVASFINTANATFAPGSSPGDLEIRDDFDLGAATVTFEINGTTAVTEYDQIKASTSAETFTVGASTKINLVWGFTPTIGDKFQIIDASGTLSGAIDIANVTSTHTVTVNVVGNDLEVEVTNVLSTNEVNISDFKVYPNPAKDEFRIESNNVNITSVSLYNLLGKKVYSNNNWNNELINVSNINSGVYILNIRADNRSLNKKVIIE